jgi:hypothetical protein
VKRAVLLAAVLLLVGAGNAKASPVLTGPEARESLTRWSLNHGMVEAKTGGCERMAERHLRCVMTETGWWGDEGLWAIEAESWYSARLLASGGVWVRWLRIVDGPACTRDPGLEPQCPPEFPF